jgi:hypothetical protein
MHHHYLHGRKLNQARNTKKVRPTHLKMEAVLSTRLNGVKIQKEVLFMWNLFHNLDFGINIL